jgi:hypothetical protein
VRADAQGAAFVGGGEPEQQLGAGCRPAGRSRPRRLIWRRGAGSGRFLGTELLDALPQAGVGVEEVEADPGGPGDRSEVDLLLVLDELADRGFGAGDGGLLPGLGGAAERGSASLGAVGVVPLMSGPAW